MQCMITITRPFSSISRTINQAACLHIDADAPLDTHTKKRKYNRAFCAWEIDLVINVKEYFPRNIPWYSESIKDGIPWFLSADENYFFPTDWSKHQPSPICQSGNMNINNLKAVFQSCFDITFHTIKCLMMLRLKFIFLDRWHTYIIDVII